MLMKHDAREPGKILLEGERSNSNVPTNIASG